MSYKKLITQGAILVLARIIAEVLVAKLKERQLNAAKKNVRSMGNITDLLKNIGLDIEAGDKE